MRPATFRSLPAGLTGWRTPASGVLEREPPAQLVTLAGVQGGGGVSSATMLLSTAVAGASSHAALALDGAGVTAGGLAALAGVCSHAGPQATAVAMFEHAAAAKEHRARTGEHLPMAVMRPYATTAERVNVIGGPPGAVPATETVAHELMEAVLAAGPDASDQQLAARCRDAAEDWAVHRACGCAGEGDGAAALARLIVSARAAHSLVCLDMGCAAGDALRLHGPSSDLHVWVVCARGDDAYVQQRLRAQPTIASREVLLIWVAARTTVTPSALRAFSRARGCPVMRLPTFAAGESWPQRAERCVRSMEALCELLA